MPVSVLFLLVKAIFEIRLSNVQKKTLSVSGFQTNCNLTPTLIFLFTKNAPKNYGSLFDFYKSSEKNS
jgi:hypothetical protein